MQTIDHRLIEVALERTQAHDFEKFVQAFFSAIFGSQYVPLGGIHDGGADGWLTSSTYGDSKNQNFIQASITEDPKSKIRSTVKRLIEFGRDPKSLLYATSRTVGLIDRLEAELSDELSCRISIRDRSYIVGQINQSPQTIQAYKSYLAKAAEFLNTIGAATLISQNNSLPARSLCVFIGQELDRRLGQSQLLESVTDSLILWSLESTDPDQKKFMTRAEVEAKVVEALPSARIYFRGVVQDRLDKLSSKSDGVSRKINFHRGDKGYCLPFETRMLIGQENLEDETLKIEVSSIFRSRANALLIDKNSNQELTQYCIEVCHSALQKTFAAQGLELSMFIADDQNGSAELPSIESHVDEAILELNLKGEEAGLVSDVSLKILRKTFYQSEPKERSFLRKLSRTYVLMFALKNEPRIVEFLRTMTSNFNLYVGADIVVRALSEHLLTKEDQMTKNALRLLSGNGSKLLLTEKTLDEIWYHLRTSDIEYQNNFRELTEFMTPILAKQVQKILIRAYFYSRFEAIDSGKKPMTWAKYISQFCSHDRLSFNQTRDELREYLVNEFAFEFEANEEVEKSVDKDELEQLAEQIFAARNKKGRDETSERILSRNSASMVLRVYARRQQLGERTASNPYGYRTWWMTQQTAVRLATGNLVVKHGARYMMRPEFILHFLSEIPSSSDVKKSYKDVFPSILGVQLGNRMDEMAFKKIIGEAKDVYSSFDESRAKVVLATKTSQLQSDFFKRYY